MQASLAAAFGDRVMLTSYDYRYFPGWKFFTVHDRRATKDQAITALRKARGLEEAELIVFGDEVNDIGMMRAADRPIAMANAKPEVKALAREIIGSNNEDSVVRRIRADRERKAGAMNPAANDRARPAAVRPPSYRAAIVMNLVAVACWAVAPTFVKVINRSFPVNFQNFWRYLVSLAVLWPAYLLTADRSRVRADLAEIRRLAGKILVIALVQYAFQFTYTFSLTLIYPGLMTLVQQSSAIFGALLAVAFFPDERRVVRDRMFLTGAVFAVSGALLVVLGGGSWGSAEFNVGVLSALAGALAWALLGTLIKRWVPHVPPLLSISSVFTILVPLFLASYAAANRGLPVPRRTSDRLGADDRLGAARGRNRPVAVLPCRARDRRGHLDQHRPAHPAARNDRLVAGIRRAALRDPDRRRYRADRRQLVRDPPAPEPEELSGSTPRPRPLCR